MTVHIPSNAWKITSYTDPNDIFAVADHSGCTAIHPGYGFLAENASFLDADFGVVATLPKTGISTDRIALIAMALLVAGALAVLATRRRDEDGPGEIAA